MTGAKVVALPENSEQAIVTCPLQNCMFSSGNLREHFYYTQLADSLKNKKAPAIAVHGKTKRLRIDYWLCTFILFHQMHEYMYMCV